MSARDVVTDDVPWIGWAIRHDRRADNPQALLDLACALSYRYFRRRPVPHDAESSAENGQRPHCGQWRE